MNVGWLCAALALGLAGCDGGRTTAARTEPAPPSASEVTLSVEAQKEAGIACEAVAIRSLPEIIRASGRVARNENQTWRVGAVTEGRIVRVLVGPGDPVQPGQVLARMHSHEIHDARAGYRKAQTELARLRGAESYATQVRDRARRLYDLKAASLEQAERAGAELRNASNAVAAAELELERIRVHLAEFLQVPVEDPVDHAGDDHLIPVRSPAAGIVLERNVTPGTVTPAAGELFVIADLSTLWVLAAVQEEDLAKLRIGMPVRVSVQAYPDRPFAGRLARLAEQLDPATRTVQARIEVPNANGLLKPEMYAACELEAGGARPALFLPPVSLQDVNGHASVFVRKSETVFEVRAVETGRRLNGLVEVTSGLHRGDQVATRGSFILKSQLLKGSLAGE